MVWIVLVILVVVKGFVSGSRAVMLKVWLTERAEAEKGEVCLLDPSSRPCCRLALYNVDHHLYQSLLVT